MEGKVQVYSARNEAAAAIVKGHLEAEGIECLLLDQEETLSHTSGEVGVYVKPEDEERARKIIAESSNS